MTPNAQIDTLILSRWLIPVEPHNVYYEHHAVAIHEGRIIDILPNETAQNLYTAKNIINLPEHAVLPGLINAHAHSPMTLIRGLADDLALMDWLMNHIWPVEKKWLHEEFMKDGTELAMAEMIRSGTTCFNEHYFHYEISAEIAEKAKMRARIGAHILELADLIGQSNVEYLSTKGIEFIEKYKNNPLVKASLAPHAPYSVSDEAFKVIHEISEKHHIPIHLHVHETAFEINEIMTKHNQRPLKHLYDLGILSPAFQAVHMTQIDDEDIEILQKTGTTVVHCPESNLKLASGFCPVQRLLDAGITVALGTDGAASNNDLDMIGEMRTAALIGKIVANSDTALSAATALRMATLNGAKSMQWDNEIGSLEIGKLADIIAIDLSDLNTQPVYNPISQIVYATNASQVSHSWINGVCVMNNRELMTLDEVAILQKTKVWQERIHETDEHHES